MKQPAFPGRIKAQKVFGKSLVFRNAVTADALGFQASHFDVRKGNKSVWKFHERFGATRVGETEKDYLYNIDLKAINAARMRYKKYLPNNVIVEELNEY
jgi:hypothetical protein